jgi:rhomboid protease GluP
VTGDDELRRGGVLPVADPARKFSGAGGDAHTADGVVPSGQFPGDPCPGRVSFPLKSRAAALSLDEVGLTHTLGDGKRLVRFVAYRDITHVQVARQGLRLGTRHSIYVFRRSQFRDAGAPEIVARCLAARIAAQPGGLQQRARIDAVDRRLRAPERCVATRGVAVLCGLVFGLQLLDPFALHVGAFVPELVRQGELWRLVSANFLHAPPLLLLLPHLLINLVCILGFGLLVERPLGAARTLLIMGGSAVGAMVGSDLAGYQDVVGASGIVAGLVGAILCLELQWPDRLPASWRLPRRLFVMVLLLQVALDFYLPFVARAAHLAGFAAGWAIARLVAASALSGRGVADLRMRLAAAAVVAVTLLALGSSAPLLMRRASALERHAGRLLRVSESLPSRFNEAAWRMVTEAQLGFEGLMLAVELAERAVAETERMDPDVLDTLSEALFAAGDRLGAIVTIDEAISITDGESYYVEQRRRFTGERAPDDRPPSPLIPWQFRPKPEPLDPEAEEPGISI